MIILARVMIIAGTPGTGKTIVCRKLVEICNLEVLNIGEIALQKGFVTIYDQRRDTYVVDEEKLVDYVIGVVSSSSGVLVLQTHYPEIIPGSIVDYVFVLRTHPLELEKRLMARGWSRKKINENVMAEILGVIAENAAQAFGDERIVEIDTTNMSPEKVAEFICSVVRGVFKPDTGVRLDWLTLLKPEEVTKFEDYVGSEDQ